VFVGAAGNVMALQDPDGAGAGDNRHGNKQSDDHSVCRAHGRFLLSAFEPSLADSGRIVYDWMKVVKTAQ
jgi:hypothetical protein